MRITKDIPPLSDDPQDFRGDAAQLLACFVDHLNAEREGNFKLQPLNPFDSTLYWWHPLNADEPTVNLFKVTAENGRGKNAGVMERLYGWSGLRQCVAFVGAHREGTAWMLASNAAFGRDHNAKILEAMRCKIVFGYLPIDAATVSRLFPEYMLKRFPRKSSKDPNLAASPS
jgi:hypothetical protein